MARSDERAAVRCVDPLCDCPKTRCTNKHVVPIVETNKRAAVWIDLRGLRTTITVQELQNMLTDHDLQVVSDADMRVLEAMAKMPTDDISDALGGARCFPNHPWSQRHVELYTAELARREVKR